MVLVRSIAPTCVLPDRVAGPEVSKGKDALSVNLAAPNLDVFEWLFGARVVGNFFGGSLSLDAATARP